MKSGSKRASPRLRPPARCAVLVGLGVVLGGPVVAHAEPRETATEEPDRFDLYARGETHAALFQRALLPGAGGAIVRTNTLAPIRQYVLLRARDVDALGTKDSLDAELSAWGNLTFGNIEPGHTVDGDVQTANVGYRQGPLSFRLGRQHVAGGAARFARFDGAQARVELGSGLSALAYGGLTVLPRWNERPGFHYLGASVDSDLRSPQALATLGRGSHALFGGRLGYTIDRFGGGLSVHDQWERGGIARFNAAADAHADLSDTARAGGTALLDVDSQRLADARLFVDASVARPLDVSLEYLHTEPALLLSRQSVLAVFSTDSYDELGGTATARVDPMLSFEATGFAQVYDTGRAGARTETAVRAATDRTGTTRLRVAYARVQAPMNGYHSLRASLVQRLMLRASATLEAYGYFYDESISGIRTSFVYVGTVSTEVAQRVHVLLGASIARSPYAALDAQGQLRLAYDFDLGPGSRTR